MKEKDQPRVANSFLATEVLLLDAVLKKCITNKDMAILCRKPAFASLLRKVTKMAHKVNHPVEHAALDPLLAVDGARCGTCGKDAGGGSYAGVPMCFVCYGSVEGNPKPTGDTEEFGGSDF